MGELDDATGLPVGLRAARLILVGETVRKTLRHGRLSLHE